MSGYKNLARRAIGVSDSSSSSDGSTTTSYTTARSSQPPHSPYDSGYPASVYTHPVGKAHPIVQLWDVNLRDQVMSKVQAQGREWQAIDVLRRGWSLEASENSVTVVLTVAENEHEQEWANLIAELKDLCTTTCGIEVEAELIIGRVSRGAGLDWSEIRWMGSPIGEANSGRSGTLGGYLQLHKNGQVMRVAVTCHHVLSSDSHGE